VCGSVGWRLGGGSRQPSRPHTNKFLPAKKYLFLKRVRPLCRYNTLKNHTDAANKASPEQHLRSAGKSANFSAAKNLHFCSKNSQKSMPLDADFDWKISLIMVY